MRIIPLAIMANHEMTRRKFLSLTTMSAAALIAGCATNPVSGRKQLMFVSEEDEIKVDKQYAPLQFSTDYGPVQDKALNNYLDQVGKKMTAKSHRPQMPYSFRVVNATYVNAYAFPGGSIAATRGILLKLDDEAELASLLGHELGHVNARHTAQQMSKGMLTQTIVGGISVLAGTQGALYGNLAAQVGSIGAGALLASYSRDNEREADALGLQYMVAAEYGSEGFVGLMDMLNSLSKHKPGAAELLFATHPMSDERYQTAVEAVQTKYGSARNNPLYRERYMDNTAKLRAVQDSIEKMQKGEEEMLKNNFGNAETLFRQALKKAPNDYAGLVMMSTCQLVQKKYAVGRQYAQMAKKVYPQEAQAYHLSGFAKLNLKNFEDAYQDFTTYQKLLPGNPNTIFFKGYAQENMQHIPEAASEYQRYLQLVQQGEYAKYSSRRLQEWRAKGYI
jgi:predicted Zn-dependent protease